MKTLNYVVVALLSFTLCSSSYAMSCTKCTQPKPEVHNKILFAAVSYDRSNWQNRNYRTYQRGYDYDRRGYNRGYRHNRYDYPRYYDRRGYDRDWQYNRGWDRRNESHWDLRNERWKSGYGDIYKNKWEKSPRERVRR